MIDIRERNANFFENIIDIEMCLDFYELGYYFEINDGRIYAIEIEQ